MGEPIKALRVTDTTDLPPLTPFFKVDNALISTRGAIMTFSGAPKVGKSAVTFMLIALSLNPDKRPDGVPLSFQIEPNHDGRAVIHAETEQSPQTQQSRLKGLLKRAHLESCPKNYYSYNFLSVELPEFMTEFEKILEQATLECGGIHSVYLDGGADSVANTNDLETSVVAVKRLTTLATKYNTPIIVVVHVNPGSDKERGHYGSEVQRRSEAIIQIKSDDDEISYMDFKYLRHTGKLDQRLTFKFDMLKGYHVADESLCSNVTTAKENELRALAKKIFAGQASFEYGDAIESLMRTRAIKERTAKEFFKEMKAYHLIFQGEDKKWRINLNS